MDINTEESPGCAASPISAALTETILPMGGRMGFKRRWLLWDEADSIFQHLSKVVPWSKSEIILGGKLVETPRKQAWMGDADVRAEVYSATRVDWTPEMLRLRGRLCQLLDKDFNYVLLNLYENGSEYIGYHADREVIEDTDLIASLSLGASRRFLVQPIRKPEGWNPKKDTLEWTLRSGDLMTMDGTMQRNYKHCVPKTAKRVGPRINLTFRIGKSLTTAPQ